MYSSNRWWKNNFFFVFGQWEFAPLERTQDPRVPRETNIPSNRANKEPILTKDELNRVNKIIKCSRMHNDCMYFGVLVSMSRLMEFVYATAADWSSKSASESTRIPVDSSPPTTWGATPKRTRPRWLTRARARLSSPKILHLFLCG